MKQGGIIGFILILFLFACTSQPEQKVAAPKHHNQLDDINTVEAIQTLLATIDSDYVEFKVDDSLQYSSQFGIDKYGTNHKQAMDLNVKPWVKADFDNNGYTDLMVIGNWYDHYVMVIMDSAENHFYLRPLTKHSFQELTFPVLKTIEDRTAIINYSISREYNGGKWTRGLKSDTLMFEYGDFVEYNKTPAKHTIEKLEYSTGFCFGSCPVFSIDISADRKSKLLGSNYNFPDGEYYTTIDSANYNMLTGLLNYIDFAALDTSYSVSWTDDQDCVLKITYDGGKVKKIEDYGLLGTFGLARVYTIFFDLRNNQKWQDKEGKMKIPVKRERARF